MKSSGFAIAASGVVFAMKFKSVWMPGLLGYGILSVAFITTSVYASSIAFSCSTVVGKFAQAAKTFKYSNTKNANWFRQITRGYAHQTQLGIRSEVSRDP